MSEIYEKVVSVRFSRVNKAYFFDANGYDLDIDDYVIVESIRGRQIGKVIQVKNDFENEGDPLKPVIRPATSKDLVAKELFNQKKEEAALGRTNEFKKYELTEKPFSGRLFKSDQLIMGSDSGNIFLTVAETEGIFGLETPAGVQYVELSEEMELDVDGNSIPELIVYVSDVSQKNVDRGAEVKIMLKNSSNIAVASPDENQIPNAEDLPKEQARTEILSDTRAYPFTINASFRGGCLFRYRPDRKDTVEDYFASGDIVNMTASNGVRLWISNGNAVKLQIVANSKTYDLAVPRAGEVIAQDIKWIKDTDGRYKVVVVDID